MFVGYLALIVITNYLFIPTWGIVRAAVTSLIAITLFHLSGLLFVKIKFDYWPFNWSFVKVARIFLPLMGILFWVNTRVLGIPLNS
jgi:hypothetical protein